MAEEVLGGHDRKSRAVKWYIFPAKFFPNAAQFENNLKKKVPAQFENNVRRCLPP
jgi:hypothetical protein